MPLGVMPVLDYDGEIISQSKTIARFLAKEFGIAGKTNLQQAKADMIVDCVTDIEIGKCIFWAISHFAGHNIEHYRTSHINILDISCLF